MTLNEASAFADSLPFWNQLSKGEQSILTDGLHEVRYQAGQAVYSGECNCLGVLFINSGILRAYLMSDDGREITMFRLREGNVCMMSASCALSFITVDVHVEAETDCEAILLPSASLQILMKRNIYFENYVHQMITERFSDVMAAMERLLFFSLQQRIAAFLIDESSAQHSDTLTLTKEQLARAIGSAREAVSRNLKLFAHSHILEVDRGTIRILDKKELYGIVGRGA